ncbi:guanylate kinase [Streptomyces avermitilis]|uniref:phosphotransferase-like protein n=1 Tax=Streptomyces avermitilis TaxID=33903 RepID=UPI0033B54AA9
MSQKQGVILYGPPAAGKDTITRALNKLDARYTLFARLKVGSGKSAGYRMGSAEQLAQLETAGDVVYVNTRYGNRYVIDRPSLNVAFVAGLPVVHLGQIDGVRALVDGYPANWTQVLLWCPQVVTAKRSEHRGDTDTADRLAAWDATREDMDAHPEMVWDLTVDTVTTKPEQSARLIDQLLHARAGVATA